MDENNTLQLVIENFESRSESRINLLENKIHELEEKLKEIELIINLGGETPNKKQLQAIAELLNLIK